MEADSCCSYPYLLPEVAAAADSPSCLLLAFAYYFEAAASVVAEAAKSWQIPVGYFGHCSAAVVAASASEAAALPKSWQNPASD